jgi:hypothetical protein
MANYFPNPVVKNNTCGETFVQVGLDIGREKDNSQIKL